MCTTPSVFTHMQSSVKVAKHLQDYQLSVIDFCVLFYSLYHRANKTYTAFVWNNFYIFNVNRIAWLSLIVFLLSNLKNKLIFRLQWALVCAYSFLTYRKTDSFLIFYKLKLEIWINYLPLSCILPVKKMVISYPCFKAPLYFKV